MAGGGVEIDSNVAEVLKLLDQASDSALRIIGSKVQGYAVRLAMGTWGNNLGLPQAIDYGVQDHTLSVGTNMVIGAYVELGTAVFYEKPPAWLQSGVQEGEHHFGQQGIKNWWYRDEKSGEWKPGAAQRAHPFLRPAMEDHAEEFKKILEAELRDAGR